MPQETRKTARLTLAEVTHNTQEKALARGGHTPTVIAEGDRRTVITEIEALATTYEGRAQQMFFVGLALAQSGEVGVLQQVFFISEAWLSRSEAGEPLKQLPSQDPQRKEVVIIAHHTIRPPHAEIVVFEMHRNSKGTLISLEASHGDEDRKDSEIRSPLVEAFVIGFLGSTFTLGD